MTASLNQPDRGSGSDSPRKSRTARLGKIALDQQAIESELRGVDVAVGASAYSEFVFGRWGTVVLANPTGNADDKAFRLDCGPPRTTDWGQRMPGVMALVNEHFVTSRLGWARLFVLADGFLVPHVDFLEFDRPGTRLQIPLRTSTLAVHSEGHTVFHPALGEIWLLDATVPHAAAAPSGPSRVVLTLDFDVPPGSAGSVIRQKTSLRRPRDILRPDLAASEVHELIKLGSTFDRSVADMAVRSFASVHFSRRSDPVSWFGWLREAAEASVDRSFASKVAAFKRFCLSERALGERFTWL